MKNIDKLRMEKIALMITVKAKIKVILLSLAQPLVSVIYAVANNMLESQGWDIYVHAAIYSRNIDGDNFMETLS